MCFACCEGAQVPSPVCLSARLFLFFTFSRQLLPATPAAGPAASVRRVSVSAGAPEHGCGGGVAASHFHFFFSHPCAPFLSVLPHPHTQPPRTHAIRRAAACRVSPPFPSPVSQVDLFLPMCVCVFVSVCMPSSTLLALLLFVFLSSLLPECFDRAVCGGDVRRTLVTEARQDAKKEKKTRSNIWWPPSLFSSSV